MPAGLQKGARCYFGCKGFIRTDGGGFVERVLADQGLSSATNQAHLREAGLKSGIMFRAARGHPLSARQKPFNRRVSRRRCNGNERSPSGVASSSITLPRTTIRLAGATGASNVRAHHAPVDAQGGAVGRR